MIGCGSGVFDKAPGLRGSATVAGEVLPQQNHGGDSAMLPPVSIIEREGALILKRLRRMWQSTTAEPNLAEGRASLSVVMWTSQQSRRK
ncbi:hypothetical protein ACR52_23905 [Pseudomonas fildesensis]|uniref:Uncharacterized protein n=1 Tax=Pseudomonas fildesensis TaxID=1674920 RepID=A0A0J8FWU0_9PSED|nr:hypothetical protein ACR52_23905 [Pseudomonas fildesensis]